MFNKYQIDYSPSLNCKYNNSIRILFLTHKQMIELNDIQCTELSMIIWSLDLENIFDFVVMEAVGML